MSLKTRLQRLEKNAPPQDPYAALTEAELDARIEALLPEFYMHVEAVEKKDPATWTKVERETMELKAWMEETDAKIERLEREGKEAA